MAHARGILGQVTLLGNRIEAGKQGQALIGDKGHDVAAPFNGEKLESQTAAKGMFGGDHFRAGHVSALGQAIQLQAY